MINTIRIMAVSISACIMILFFETTSFSTTHLLKMQTVYVPVYAIIFHGDRDNIFNLTATVSIRNTDIKRPLVLESVDYYDTGGKLIKKYLPQPRKLKPLESIHYIVKESDVDGGPGANFIVKWHSDKPVSTPLIESIMIGTRNQQGISFVSRGVIITEK